MKLPKGIGKILALAAGATHGVSFAEVDPSTGQILSAAQGGDQEVLGQIKSIDGACIEVEGPNGESHFVDASTGKMMGRDVGRGFSQSNPKYQRRYK